MADVTPTSVSFPSHFVDPAEKRGKNWCLAYVKAFENEAASMPMEGRLFKGNEHYDRLRKYSRGEQSENAYKELMGLKKEKGKLNTSYRNLDFGILKVAPKLKNVLVNKVVNQPYKLNIKPIDPGSISERREYRGKLMELVISQEHIKRSAFLQKLGLQSPVPQGATPPQNLQEVDVFMDQYPKNNIAMEVKDYLTFAMYYNDWEQQGREMVSDLVEIGVAGVRVYVDENGMVRLRRTWPERVIMNRCLYPDFRDMIRVGEYHEMTVAELKKRTKGSLGEETYKMLANQCKDGNGENNRYTGACRDYYSSSTFSYAYDVEKVTILDAVWKSVDNETYLEKNNRAGNSRMIKESHDYVPYKGDPSVNGGAGYADDEFNKTFEGKKQIYRRQVTNIYKCSYVCGSDVAFDFGLMNDMPRSVSNLAETQLPYIFVSTDFMSTIGTIEEVLDQIQMNWLQFQSHIAASKPDGVMIERRALSKLTALNGTKFDPKEALMMYSEIGSIVFDGYDQHGNPLPWLPVKEIKNGMSEAADQHFQKIIQLLDLARTMVGINALTEGQNPAERLGKAVGEMSVMASDNALSHLNDAYSKLYERSARQMVTLMQGSIERMDENSFNEALGFESWNILNINKDIGLRELGITIEEGPDQYLRDKISIILQKMVDNKEINGEDAILVEMEDNIYRQLGMIRKNRKERDQVAAANQEQLVRAQGQEQQKHEEMKGQAAMQQLQAQMQLEQQKLALTYQFQRQAEQEKFMQSVVLAKLEAREKLSLEQEKWTNKIFETKMVLESEERQAEMQAEASKEIAENRPAPASN